MLVDKEQHVFNPMGRNVDGTKIYWRCRESVRKRNKSKNACPAKAMTKGIHVLKWTEVHNHEVFDHQLNGQNYNKKYTGYDKRSNKIWKRPDGFYT